MAKKTCEACGREIGIMTGKVKLKDGYICTDCYRKLGFSSWNGNEMVQAGTMTLTEIQAFSDRKEQELLEIQNFMPTGNVGLLAKFDDQKKEMILSEKEHISYKPYHYTLFRYDQIVDFEILENGSSVASGGLGRAMVGGLLFGSAGAIVGASTRKQSNVCSDLKVKITVKDYLKPAFYITLINSDQKKSGLIYKTNMKLAQDLISQLQLIVNSMQASGERQNQTVVSTADEIRKFKELFDDGIITQEEFDAKKKELLDF